MTHRNHNEREFEAFLAGEESELARLYRRLPQAEPDAKLDATVLNLARAAVEPQRVNALRHAKSRHPRPWWLVGLSSAAGVVLAAGIAWQMRHGFDGHPAANMTPAPQSRAAQSGREVIPISAITPPAEAEVPVAPAAPPAPPPPPALSDSVPGAAAARPQPPAQRLAKSSAAPRDADKAKTEAARDAGPVTTIAAEPEPAPAPAAAPAPVQASPVDMQAESTAANSGSDKLAARSDKGGTAAAPKPFADGERALDHNSVERKAAIASGSRREEYGLSAEEAAAGEASARPEIRQRAPARLQSDAAADGRVTEAPRYSKAVPDNALASAPPRPAAEAAPAFEPPAAAPAADAPAADVAARAKISDAEAPAAAAAPTADAYTSAAAPPAPATATAATTTAATQPSATPPLGGINAGRSSTDDETARRATALEHNARLAPAKWVEQIQQLLREQRRDEARENLDLFRKRHPDFVLPPELRELK